MIIGIIVLMLVLSSLKWMAWKITCEAVLLYYAESGCELPDKETIEKYRSKVINKTFGVKGF